ncbi:MAG: hypothetical protein AAF675_00600 [Pseudomonadota bacterium]
MPLITRFNHEKGLKRLMTAPYDLAPEAALGGSMRLSEASAEHQSRFRRYGMALAEAAATAIPWWETIIASWIEETGDEETGIFEAFNRRAAGAAAHPRVVHAVREGWLSCTALNAALPAPERVAPQVFLLGWMGEAGEEELVRLLACQPYWPIGLDADGRWC